MIKKLILFYITFFCFFSVKGQEIALSKDVSSLSSVHRLDLPALNNAELQKFYLQSDKNTANRFAEARDVNIDPHSSGTWESTKSDMMIWRYIVRSPNAYSINLGFTEFELAESANLYIYNSSQTEILGPFTAKDNDDHLQLWTPIISGEEIVLELQIKSEDIEKNVLVLSRINHDFADIRRSLQSGSCNLDVICNAQDGWGIVDNYRDIISSVGAYSFNGIDQCSGVLINNARNDCTPYFLTAEHCGINNSNSASVVVYWNYQNSYCRQPGSPESGRDGDGSRTSFNTGAVLKAELGESDFTLIELDDPLDTDLDLYLAGWNISRVLPDTTICIHHPGVEEKRISFEFDPIDYDPTGQDTTHLLVNDWDIGTTEGGSSGSPLFNPQKQIIGQLTGGLAACGNNDYDSYGWMRWSWAGGGSPQSSLQPWLDPDNSGVTQLQGRGCNYGVISSNSFFDICGLDQDSLVIGVQADGLFNSDVTYSVSGLPSSLIASFDFDVLAIDLENRLVVSGFSGLGSQEFSFSIDVSDGTNSASTTIFVNYYADLPSIPINQLPPNGASDLSLNATLNVSGNQGYQYVFELARDINFDDIILTETIESNSLNLSDLIENTDYFWRVKAKNLCGESGWSEVFQFSTTSIFCSILHSSGEPIEISSENPTNIQSDISFPYGVIVEDINIPNVTGEHDYIEDLIIKLLYGGSESVLLSEICSDENDFNVGFDDNSLVSAFPCPPIDGRLYRPKTPLDVFNGKFAGGNWQLDIEDTAYIDGGQLNEWSMEVCFSNPQLSVIVPRNHREYNCSEELNIEAYIYSEETDDWKIRVKNNMSATLDIDYSSSSSHSSSRFISILDRNQLSPGVNQLIIELLNSNMTEVLASSYMEVYLEDDIGTPLIQYPESNSKILPENLNEISWQSNFDGEFIVEIANDSYFENIIWTMGGFDSNSVQVQDVLESRVYYLRVILINGNCRSISSTTKFEIDDATTSTNDEDEAIQFTLFPNPVIKECRLVGPLSKGDKISIYNIKGQLLYKELSVEQSNAKNINLGFLPEGIYILLIDTNNTQYRERIIKL